MPNNQEQQFSTGDHYKLSIGVILQGLILASILWAGKSMIDIQLDLAKLISTTESVIARVSLLETRQHSNEDGIKLLQLRAARIDAIRGVKNAN